MLLSLEGEEKVEEEGMGRIKKKKEIGTEGWGNW